MKKNVQITDIRLINHQLLQAGYTTPCQIVAHLGVMQAQDFNAAKWAIGTRLSGCTDKTITEAFDKGEILRTHVLRPTWHFVTPEAAYQPPVGKSNLFLLPAFNEYIVGYKDSADVLTSENHSKAISSNGVFRPAIIKDGQVIGLWEKTASGKKIIEVTPFVPIDDATQQLINASAEKFRVFLC